MALISARNLTKTYPSRSGEVHALAGLDLDIEAGTVRALLGPNGAGKTTTVKILTTLIAATSGTATIAGNDVATNPDQIRKMIGVSGQYAAVDEHLTAIENLTMIGKLYRLPAAAAKKRAKELVELFDLTEASNRPVKGFSGGMRRRIDLAGALVINPPILFLDEPTTGLDPRSRLGLWAVINERVREGTTVLLTTQYLEEADQLADQISVIDHGRVIADGTADKLKAQVGGHRLVVTIVDPARSAEAAEILTALATESATIDDSGRTIQAAVAEGPQELQQVLARLAEAGIELHDAGMRRPTLDDVFLSLTGHVAEATEATEGAEQ